MQTCFLADTAGGVWGAAWCWRLTVHEAGRLQHLLVVGVVQATLGPEGDLPLHLLKRRPFSFGFTQPSQVPLHCHYGDGTQNYNEEGKHTLETEP